MIVRRDVEGHPAQPVESDFPDVGHAIEIGISRRRGAIECAETVVGDAKLVGEKLFAVVCSCRILPGDFAVFLDENAVLIHDTVHEQGVEFVAERTRVVGIKAQW